MSAGDPERIEEARGVGGHVVERIGRGGPPAGLPRRDHGRQVRRRELGQMGRLADVAVVEPDDAKAFRRQAVAERNRPADELRGEAHDQQHGRIALAPEALVFDVDPVGADLRHDGDLPW